MPVPKWFPFQMTYTKPTHLQTLRAHGVALKTALLDRRGVSAVEFALVAPLLIAIPIPIFDIGSSLHAKMQVDEAVQAGAQYVIMHTYDTAHIASAAASATSLAVTVTSSEACGCPSGTTITTAVCGAACPDGAPAGKYATINGTANYTPLISYPVYGRAFTMTASSTVREP